MDITFKDVVLPAATELIDAGVAENIYWFSLPINATSFSSPEAKVLSAGNENEYGLPPAVIVPKRVD